jgi:membrane protein DedA with SNARE-associated domain
MRRWARIFIVAALLFLPIVIISVDYLEDFVEANGQGVASGVISLILNLPRNAISLASGAGYVGIFILMLMEAAALPVPSEIILPFAGYLVYTGKLEFFTVLLVSTLAALIGSFVDYYLGLKLGRGIFTALPRIPFLDAQRVQNAEAWFHRHGPMTVALFRLIPGGRVLISFPAGLYRMNKLAFALYTLAGCLPWNIALICLGWWLGASWNVVVEAFRYINLVAYGVLALIVVWIGWRLAPRNQMNREETSKPAQA